MLRSLAIRDLAVVDRLELAVPLAHRLQSARDEGYDHVVRDRPEAPERLRRRDPKGNHDRRGAPGTHDGDTGLDRPAGRHAVVDHDHAASGQLGRGEVSPKAADAGHDLLELSSDLGLEHRPGEPCVPGPPFVDQDEPALRDRAEPVLRVPGSADLADHQHVQRSSEVHRDLEGDGDPAPRDSEDQRFTQAKTVDLGREKPPCLGAIL